MTTLQASHPGNTNAMKHGVYSPRAMAAEAEEAADVLMARPHTVENRPRGGGRDRAGAGASSGWTRRWRSGGCSSARCWPINQGSLTEVQHWAGRADMRTTQRYLHHKSRAGEARRLAEARVADGVAEQGVSEVTSST